jgi:hypothetical protein
MHVPRVVFPSACTKKYSIESAIPNDIIAVFVQLDAIELAQV